MEFHIDYPINCGRKNYPGTGNVGTKLDKMFTFNLPDDISATKIMMFEGGWKKLLDDDEFGCPGNRNDSAVNLCCLLHAGGVEDVVGWYEDFDGFVKLTLSDYFQTLDAIHRVEPYLEKWGPKGKKDDALCYMV